MPRTRITTEQVGDGEVTRDDLNITDTGKAVVRRILQGEGVSFNSTGADAGTGDVTINVVPTIASFLLKVDAGLIIKNDGGFVQP